MKHLSTLAIVCLGLLLWSCESSKDSEATYVKSYSAEQFFKNTSIGGGAFSEDEDKLLFSSNETGIYNVYEIDLATEEKKAPTSSTEESFFALDYFPNSSRVLYSADKGGNENSHLYLLKEDGTSEDLTPGENEKASFGGWSKDDKYLYYVSNKRNPALFDAYKMNIEDRTEEMLYQNDQAFDISAFTEDEKYVALSKSITTSENILYLYNRETEEMTAISDPQKKGVSAASGFSDDGKTLFFISDEGENFKYLASYDIETGEKQIIMKKDWDIMYSYLSEKETYRVTGINADGKNEILVFNNETGMEVEFPDIPDGDVLGVNISESEEKMRLTVGSSKTSSNIYLYDFKTKELTKLTETLNPELDPQFLVEAEVVRYKSFDGLEIPAIFYKPKQASAENKVPGLVWVHGGPGGQSRVGYSPTMQYLLNQGYAILAVNNRGSSGYGKEFYKMDDQNHGDKDLMDCIYGKKYLQGLSYIDSAKIGIYGGSYGGFMVMAAMTNKPEAFEAGVNLFGVTNWLRTLKSIPPYWESFREALYAEMGDPYSEDSARLYNISPVFHGDKVKNPVMVLQGANDPRVLKVESDDMVEAIKKQGVPVEYVVFDDEGHGFVKKENQIEAAVKVVDFLDKHLKGEKEETQASL